MPKSKSKPDTYRGKKVSRLKPSDPHIKLSRIYEKPVLTTDQVMELIYAHSDSGEERDKIIWEIVYMSAMARTPMERTLCTFEAQVAGKWRSFYAEVQGGCVILSQ